MGILEWIRKPLNMVRYVFKSPRVNWFQFFVGGGQRVTPAEDHLLDIGDGSARYSIEGQPVFACGNPFAGTEIRGENSSGSVFHRRKSSGSGLGPRYLCRDTRGHQRVQVTNWVGGKACQSFDLFVG